MILGKRFSNVCKGGGTDISGPLAVGGQFTAPEYTVNTNRGQNCSENPRESFEGIGLVVGGSTNTQNTLVHGDSLNAGGGTLSEIKELNSAEGCAVYDNIGTGVFNFKAAENVALRASYILAMHEPNMYIDDTGNITDLGSGNSSFKVFTFNTCNSGNCNVGGMLSNPEAIFLGFTGYDGPTGDVPSATDTVVFNACNFSNVVRHLYLHLDRFL